MSKDKDPCQQLIEALATILSSANYVASEIQNPPLVHHSAMTIGTGGGENSISVFAAGPDPINRPAFLADFRARAEAAECKAKEAARLIAPQMAPRFNMNEVAWLDMVCELSHYLVDGAKQRTGRAEYFEEKYKQLNDLRFSLAVKAKNQQAPARADTTGWLTVKAALELANTLDSSVTKPMITRACNDGAIVAVGKRRGRQVDPKSVTAWVKIRKSGERSAEHKDDQAKRAIDAARTPAAVRTWECLSCERDFESAVKPKRCTCPGGGPISLKLEAPQPIATIAQRCATTKRR